MCRGESEGESIVDELLGSCEVHSTSLALLKIFLNINTMHQNSIDLMLIPIHHGIELYLFFGFIEHLVDVPLIPIAL